MKIRLSETEPRAAATAVRVGASSLSCCRSTSKGGRKSMVSSGWLGLGFFPVLMVLWAAQAGSGDPVVEAGFRVKLWTLFGVLPILSGWALVNSIFPKSQTSIPGENRQLLLRRSVP